MVGQRYGNVSYDQSGGTWFHVPNFPVPRGWSHSHIDILIDIPIGAVSYPQVAPQWFWTSKYLRTDDGRTIDHFFINRSNEKEHGEKGWGHFCIHPKSWEPAGANLRVGHTLLSYLDLIAVVFKDRKTLAR